MTVLTWVHQTSGCCSAHPGLTLRISISFAGEVAEQTTFPLSISSREALMEELPISNPKRNSDIKNELYLNE
jgi:hypothetical protein